MSLLEDQFASLHPRNPMTRRGFIVTSLAGGFAAATLPVSAQTISTDSAGLTAGEIKVPVSDGLVPAYRAQPEGKTGLPVVLVVQEIFGVHEHIRDLCRRLARLGYLAIAPELYARQGDASKYSTIPDLIANIVSKVPDAQVLGDLDATVAWAGANGGNFDKLGITGFCWGGRFVWLYAAHNPAVKAGAAWYGPLVGKASALTPLFPVDIADALKAPVLGLYGGKDQGITAEHVERMRAALAASTAPAAKKSEIVVFPDAGHAFNADYRPSYVKADAENGWARMLAWFKLYGAA